MDEQKYLLENEKIINTNSSEFQSSKNFLNIRELLNIIHLGISFCILFIAYNTVQSFETSVNHNLGLITLGTLYFIFSISNLIAGPIVTFLGERLSLFIGSCCYVCFIGAHLYIEYYTLIPGAILIGLGAAILWAAQGSYLAKNSNEKTIGFYSGIFFGIFMLNAVFGNLLAAILLNSGKNTFFLFLLFLFISCFGSISFLFLRKPIMKDDEKEIKKSINLKEVFSFFFELKMWMMVPVVIYSGFSQSYFYSKLPQMIDKKLLGYVMACFGGSDTLGSVILGKLSDKIGRTPIMILSTLLGFGGYILSWFVNNEKNYLFFIIMVLLGLSDAGYNTQMYAVFGIFQPTKLEASYAYLKLWQASTSGIAYFYSLFLNLHEIIILISITLLLSILSFIYCDLFITNVNEKK